LKGRETARQRNKETPEESRASCRYQQIDASGTAAQRKICEDIQLQCIADVPSVPLGQFVQTTAYRSSLTGILPGFPTFWIVRPA
jgi:peptide/nickel transport system substrate-binding protein